MQNSLSKPEILLGMGSHMTIKLWCILEEYLLNVYIYKISDHQRERMGKLRTQYLHFIYGINRMLLYNTVFHTEPRGHYL